jgi:tetrahydromethanopterin S-methyltransferase subunit G
MHLMRESWTDARLDDLNEKVDRGFGKMEKRFEQMERRFERIDEKFEALYRLLAQCMLGMMAIMVGGFATLLAAVIWV